MKPLRGSWYENCRDPGSIAGYETTAETFTSAAGFLTDMK